MMAMSDSYRLEYARDRRRSASQPRCRIALLLGAAMVAHAEPTDADFIVARDAFRAGDAAKLDRVAPQLKGHLLESYVTYWQIRLKLDDADPERVLAFLDRNDGRPLADRLRTEWLKSLAKRSEWNRFEAQYPRRAGEDTELACDAIQWHQTRQGDAALEEARPYWLTGQEQPEACRTLFAAMIATGRLSGDDIWARFRMAHETGNTRLASALIARLPSGEGAASNANSTASIATLPRRLPSGEFSIRHRARAANSRCMPSTAPRAAIRSRPATGS